MRLLLIRHGNTFKSGETPVRVGANEDLPLTEEGEAQARRLGAQLKAAGIMPAAAVTGPLRRTRRHLEIVLDELGAAAAVAVDERLREIDYGPWGGLSDDEIARRFGAKAAAELDAWNRESRWPRETVTWRPAPETIARNAAALTSELAARLGTEDCALVCSSNGILRYFLEMTEKKMAAAGDHGKEKMKTGALSLLDVRGTAVRVVFWNLPAGTPLPA